MLLQFGVWIAYLLVAYCYFGVGFAGYHAFGSMTGSQIMYSLGHPIWVVCMAEIMIIVHVCGSFQVWLAFCHAQSAVGHSDTQHWTATINTWSFTLGKCCSWSHAVTCPDICMLIVAVVINLCIIDCIRFYICLPKKV